MKFDKYIFSICVYCRPQQLWKVTFLNLCILWIKFQESTLLQKIR